MTVKTQNKVRTALAEASVFIRKALDEAHKADAQAAPILSYSASAEAALRHAYRVLALRRIP